MGRGVAIMVDEHRDPQLAGLFERRARLEDETFLANWKLDDRHIRFLPRPDAPEAIIAYGIHITRPIVLQRTYLLLASKSARFLSWLAQPGTNVWLIPRDIAVREWAKEGAGTGEDIYSYALPLGEIIEPSLAIEQALKHIGYTSD